MPTPFRIKQIENNRWVPNHLSVMNSAHYSHGGDQPALFVDIRNSLFAAIDNQLPGEFTKDGEIDNYKEHLFSRIDQRTREKIADGFMFEGMVFSLSSNAQTNYIAMLAAKSMLSYPVTINTLDDSDVLSLADEDAVTHFCSTALNAAREVIDVGSELKQEVRQANTSEQLNDITI